MHKTTVLLAFMTLVCACDRDRPAADEETPPPPVLDTTVNRPDTFPAKVTAPYAVPNDSMTILVEINEEDVKLPNPRVPAGQIKFVLYNTGKQPHALEIKASYGARWRTLPAPPNGQVSLQVPMMSGVYLVYCPLKHGSKDHSQVNNRFIID